MDKVCCFCGKPYGEYGNDIRPLVTSKGDRCCDECNINIVIPNRLKFWFNNNLYGYIIVENENKLPINEYGLTTKKLDEILIFNTYEEADHHIKIDQLWHHTVQRVTLREDN